MLPGPPWLNERTIGKERPLGMPNPPGPLLNEVDRMKRPSLESLFGAEKLPMSPMKPEDDLPKPLSEPIPSPNPDALREPEGIPLRPELVRLMAC